MKTENLLFVPLNNGVAVCDGNRIRGNGYLAVAHISFNRKVCYRTQDLTAEARQEIEDFAQKGNMSVSASRPYSFALVPLIYSQINI